MSDLFGVGEITASSLNSLNLFDAIVDSSVAATGNIYTTVDAAIGDGTNSSIYIKSGSYDGFTVDQDNIYITGDPDAFITGKVSISGKSTRISGLSFTPDGSNDCISLISGSDTAIIDNNRFVGGSTGTSSEIVIEILSAAIGPFWIINNIFSNVTGYTIIDIDTDPCFIINNLFVGNTGLQLSVGKGSGVDYCVIGNNTMETNGSTDIELYDENNSNICFFGNNVNGCTIEDGAGSSPSDVIPATISDGNLT